MISHSNAPETSIGKGSSVLVSFFGDADDDDDAMPRATKVETRQTRSSRITRDAMLRCLRLYRTHQQVSPSEVRDETTYDLVIMEDLVGSCGGEEDQRWLQLLVGQYVESARQM